MAEQFLDRPNIRATFQQMSREAVSQGVTRRRFGDSLTLEARVLLTADGDFGFAFTLQGSSVFTVGTAMTTDASGDFLMAGDFIGTLDIDPGASVTHLTSEAGESYPNSFIAK